LDATITPPLSIPATGGEVTTCRGLVALASILEGSAVDADVCAALQSNYAATCGCSAVEASTTGVAEETTTGVAVEATTTAAAEEATTTAADVGPGGGPGAPDVTEEPATTGMPEEPTTEGDSYSVVPPMDPVEPGQPGDDEDTPSSAPSMAVMVESNMPSMAETGTSMPVEDAAAGGGGGSGGGSGGGGSGGGITPFPTAEPTSAAAKSAITMLALVGVLVAMM